MVNATPDLLIIGGGPAGLALALAARQRGLAVTVADGLRPPADKACGEGVMPDSLAALESLGVEVPQQESFPFRGIRFIDRGVTVKADFPAMPGRGVRRTVLHRVMVEQAEAAGVRLEWNTPYTPAKLALTKVPWIVGADGTSSLVRNYAGLDQPAASRMRFGFRRHYRVKPWSEFVDVHWGAGFQVYVTPVGADCVGVAVIADDPSLRLDAALAGVPALAKHLDAAEIVTTDRGAATASRHLHRVTSGNLALIGDASGSVDAITGEGLSLAFRQAPVLAAAIANGELAAYQKAHRSIAMRPALMAAVLLGLGDHAALRSAAFRGMAALPFIFKTLLALHIGAHSTSQINSYETHPAQSHSTALSPRTVHSGPAGGRNEPAARPRADARRVHAE